MSVFGRGRGEALAVHLGRGAWMTVDSFVADDAQRPVTLEYLEAIGVGPASIKRIVATHWDQDHINGITEIVRQAPHAKLFLSAALKSGDLTKLLLRNEARTFSSPHGSGTREFSRLLDLLVAQGRRPATVSEDTVLWDRESVRVTAVAPSARVAEEALVAPLVSALQAAHTGDAIREPTPNASSLAMVLTATGGNALLGADLETSPQHDAGWAAVRSCETMRGVSCALVKVPHHGSSNADDALVWQLHVESGAMHAITRFNNGPRSLPTTADCQRLLDRGAQGHVLGDPARKTRLHGVVGRRVRAATRDGIWLLTGPVGHLRWRATPGDPGSNRTDVFGATVTLEDARAA